MSFPLADVCRTALFSALLATTGLPVHAGDTDARLARDGIAKVKSGYSFDETIERLKQDIAGKVVARLGVLLRTPSQGLRHRENEIKVVPKRHLCAMLTQLVHSRQSRGQETMLGKCLVAPFRRPLPPLSGIRRRVPLNRLQSDQGHKQMWLRE